MKLSKTPLKAAIFSTMLCTISFSLSTKAMAEIKFDLNVESTTKQQMLNDIQFMANISGMSSTPMHRKIFGNVNGSAYSTWLTQRVFAVGKDPCGSGNAVACVIPMKDNHKMWVTPNYTKFDHPQVSRVSIVYHEARHTESQNGNWSHATCPKPFRGPDGRDMKSIWTGLPLEGQPACDVTPFGSYGSQTILLKNIAKFCQNCNSKVKADADLFGNDQLGRIIDAQAKAAMKADLGVNDAMLTRRTIFN